jgi:hypothetical protein
LLTTFNFYFMETTRIHSLHELQLKMPRILEQYGGDRELSLLALANPLEALRKIGFDFTEEAAEEIEAHVRFGKEGAAGYKSLKADIETLAGEKVSAAQPELLADLIIRLSSPHSEAATDKKKAKSLRPRKEIIALVTQKPVRKGNDIADPLEEIKDLHPVIPKLIALRKLDFLHPGFADKKTIQSINERKLPLTQIKFKLNRHSD